MAPIHLPNPLTFRVLKNLRRLNGSALLQIFGLIQRAETLPQGSPKWGMLLSRQVYQEENNVPYQVSIQQVCLDRLTIYGKQIRNTDFLLHENTTTTSLPWYLVKLANIKQDVMVSSLTLNIRMTQLFQKSGPMVRCIQIYYHSNSYEIIPYFEGQLIAVYP